jgi:hypothetical protein
MASCMGTSDWARIRAFSLQAVARWACRVLASVRGRERTEIWIMTPRFEVALGRDMEGANYDRGATTATVVSDAARTRAVLRDSFCVSELDMPDQQVQQPIHGKRSPGAQGR